MYVPASVAFAPVTVVGVGPASLFVIHVVRDALGKQKTSILAQGGKDKKNAGEHPGFYGGEALGFGRVGRHCVENVDQHQEERDQQRHSS